ncbi:kinase-like domain-containing protein [Syncephalastrum racemosum]|uniref:Kinase-like domain-containing protein n=1 Tax=Syncephalastrum racemosum TaxID=13706 RepID=A0A1X2HT76_SYNRA|nr:kinase-like domain-containing protein [Syncephalastrum racemosum]
MLKKAFAGNLRVLPILNVVLHTHTHNVGKEYMLDTEIDILKQIRHPHIISMHGLYEDKEAVYIVTDLAKGGELLLQLYNRGHYTETDAAKLTRQMLQGIAYLHEHDIVHRDLKPENLLLRSNEPDSPLLISDFGMSRILKEHDDIMTTACGTPGYVAPEVLLREGYSTAADLWSAGVIVYTLLCGYTPFYGADMAALIESVISGRYEFDEEYWKDISDSAKDFINGLLTYDPAERLTAEAALQHPWLSSTNPSTHNLLASITRGRQNSLSSSRSFVSALGDPAENKIPRKSSSACAQQESTRNKLAGRIK